jgi:hypothetical protein
MQGQNILEIEEKASDHMNTHTLLKNIITK